MNEASAKPARISARELAGLESGHVMDDPELGCILHPEAAQALRAMKHAAALAQIELKVVSAWRSFQQQLAIWNGKFDGRRPLLDRACRPLDASCLSDSQIVDAILLWSALPGASRHHWGTDCDVIDASVLAAGERFELVPEEYASGGKFELLGRWLERHAGEFGFFRPYDRDRGGVQPEPWHLSFAPLAGPALADCTLDGLRAAIAGADIRGHEQLLARLPDLHERYVLAVATPESGIVAWSSG